MIDYSSLSLEELQELLLLSFQLNKEVVKQYFEPRLQLHAEEIRQILQQEMNALAKKEFGTVVAFLLAEPIVRSQMKAALETSIDGQEVVDRLKYFHRDVKNILQDASKKTLGSSLPLVRISIREKESYTTLLKELTEIIRQHSANPDEVVRPDKEIAYSPIQEALSKVEGSAMTGEVPGKIEKKILLIVPAEVRQKVMQALVPNYVATEQEPLLTELLTTGEASQTVYFNGNGRQLGDFFQRLKKKGILYGAEYDTELAEWISQYFSFWHKDKGDFTPVKYSGILKVFREGHTPKQPITL
jgi:hypothetical protein